MSVTGIAASGISVATARLDAAAATIARQSTGDDKQADLARAAAEAATAKTEAAANVAVARTGSRTVGALVDILV